MNENKIITDIEQLTPEWMTNIFKKKGYLSQGKVTKITRKNIHESGSSHIHFLRLKFSNNAQSVPNSPEIAVKIRDDEVAEKIRKISRTLRANHEIKFYNHVADSMKNLLIPVCYNADYSEATGTSHLILEDLSETHLCLSEDYYPPSKPYLEKAIDCLAELHAFWWDHNKLKDLSKDSYFLYNFKENSSSEEEVFNWFEYERGTLNRMIQSLEDRISDNRKEFLKNIFKLYPQLAYERMKKENLTIIHGDAHYRNFLYPRDILNQKSKSILSDWDTWSIGVGTQDLAYMMGLFFYPDYRRLIEEDLIKRYYNNLLNFGIKDYSWDDCWDDYRLSAFLNIYRIIQWWSENKPWWTGLVARLEFSISTIEDLKCMELLES